MLGRDFLQNDSDGGQGRPDAVHHGLRQFFQQVSFFRSAVSLQNLNVEHWHGVLSSENELKSLNPSGGHHL
jgi:hypothetical protein